MQHGGTWRQGEPDRFHGSTEHSEAVVKKDSPNDHFLSIVSRVFLLCQKIEKAIIFVIHIIE